MAAVDELADFYAAAPQNGGTVGTDIFTHQMPANPDVCVVFYQYPGGPTDWTYGSRNAENVMIQVQTRAKTRADSEGKCYDVYKKLDRQANVTIGGVLYHVIHASVAGGQGKRGGRSCFCQRHDGDTDTA